MFKDIIQPEILPPQEKLIDTILAIKKACRNDNPYKNFEHGFISCHLFYCIIKKNRNRFTQYEIFGSMLGVLGHVIDNRNIHCRYLRRINDPLIGLYGDAFGEQHNAFFIMKLIIDLYQLLDHLRMDEIKKVMDEIQRTIFVASGSKTFSRFNRLQFIISKNTYHWSNDEHRQLILNLVSLIAYNYMAMKSYDSAKRFLELLHQEILAEVPN